MAVQSSSTDTFHLAITMAGAGSAGCYTGGVMDYLFEILDLWERARKDPPDLLAHHKEKIPNHKVVIEAMGGTSAGGMTTTMSAIYALNGKIKPVKKPVANVAEPQDNLFYDSWVLMDDHNKDDARPLFEKLWDLDDLRKGYIGSLLNSKFIDTIADQSFAFEGDIEKAALGLPSYISKDLQLLFSHCLLRGIPLQVNFETAIAKKGHKSIIPNHTTFEHYIISQYHLNRGEKPDLDKYLWLNPYTERYASTMKLTTKATGAFPAGLLYREFTPDHFNEAYLKTTMKRILLGEFWNANPDPDNKIKLDFFPENYSSYTVDGGAINNEPYREVLSILQRKEAEAPVPGSVNYGVIMIDPFPDRAQKLMPYDKPNDVIDVVGNIIGTLTDQSRIKRREVLEAEDANNFRSIIFPRKWKKNKDGTLAGPETVAIATSSGQAFGGFLDIRFREHDFFLGRNNARNFVRYWFSLPYQKEDKEKNIPKVVHPLHANWTDEMIEAFIIEKEGGFYLPIIPDLNILIEKDKGLKVDQYDYDIQEMPKFDPTTLFKSKGKIEERFREILKMLKARDFREAIKQAHEEQVNQLPPRDQQRMRDKQNEIEASLKLAQHWMGRFYRPSLLSRAGNLLAKPFMGLGWLIAKYLLPKMMTKKVIHMLLDDLAKKGLLK